ncbi:fatty acid desaturase family protein [Acinetobacter baumannii]|uniref:fatty acid desaturase family protein n=1 Tax=Acinetobacter baumannii TaxID=470 RepID=UPI001C5C0186|nr:acyl-CoA desaturase [Acinetobacter baumannii]MCG5760560.1 acyl-CoA desaturase [Acinetobacter baumannii]MCG5808588.1 acyl-CoA desaturase [Acinetobacter baumannii]MCG5823426.1 acyl-CoA desaturase [Acinetobacter baumannii]MCG5830928.1 acyl-CoA desaturase [Acinetobacter baumannii]MCG5838376.1 acyl-CoA desaturase [Acinetobacter baumannii]
MALKVSIASKSAHLTPEQTEEFGRRVEQIRQDVMQNLGEQDAKYIYKVRNFVRYTEIASRGMLMFGGWIPPVWLLGTGLLGISKIVENMELGHNVMHGQFDWLNEPSLNGNTYDWDTIASGDDWRETHNYVHHTYTNIVGKDHDVGYGILRVSDQQKWEPRHLFNIPLALQLMFFFEWYVGVQNLHLEDALVYKTKSWKQVWKDAAKVRKKATRQVLKDYVFFPVISGPMFLPVFAGNVVANIIRNLWSSAVIFNGHFTEDAETFEPDNTDTETKAEWYLRQIRGSSNFSGTEWLHFMSGNLSHQIEHHLFPDMPANRYKEVAPKIKALCAEYGINYNEANFMRQFWSVWVRLAKCSLPNHTTAKVMQTLEKLKAKFKFA